MVLAASAEPSFSIPYQRIRGVIRAVDTYRSRQTIYTRKEAGDRNLPVRLSAMMCTEGRDPLRSLITHPAPPHFGVCWHSSCCPRMQKPHEHLQPIGLLIYSPFLLLVKAKVAIRSNRLERLTAIEGSHRSVPCHRSPPRRAFCATPGERCGGAAKSQRPSLPPSTTWFDHEGTRKPRPQLGKSRQEAPPGL